MKVLKPIEAPEPITAADATAMYKLYNSTFNPGQDNSTNVAFGLKKMKEMLEAFEEAGADHVRVYFGAIQNDGVKAQMEPFVQTTVFFQAAKEEPENSGNIDDLAFDKISPYDVGTPCPPPRCPGRSNY